MKDNIVQQYSYQFALRIIGLYKDLIEEKEYVLSKQLLKAGTSIGANVEEALAGQSRPDFLAKMAIASKEARECNYWLRLLRDSGYVSEEEIQPYLNESNELIKLLTSIVKTTKQNPN